MASDRARLLFVVVFLFLGAPLASDAQDQVRVSASATGTTVNATSVLGNGTARMSGTLYGGEGTVTWNDLSLRVSYAQGAIGIGLGESSLSDPPRDASNGGVVGTLLDNVFGPGGGATALRDVDMVDGRVMLGWNAVDGLELAAGAHGRARLMDDESERLVLYILQARYEAPIVSRSVRGVVEGWHSVAGNASENDSSCSGRGGSVGAIAVFGPVRTRVSYVIDQARYGNSVRRETVEGLSISVGYFLR